MAGYKETYSEVFEITHKDKVIGYAVDEDTADDLVLFFEDKLGFWGKAVKFAFVCGIFVGSLAAIVITFIMLKGLQ